MTVPTNDNMSGSRPSGPNASGPGWNPEGYARNAGFVPHLGAPVLDLLGLAGGERVLDLGCGNGTLTRQIRDLGCDVVGVDASAAQIEAARALGLDAHVMDGTALTFADEFDAVFSNAALHWMRPPEAVAAGVFRALKPGGKFAAEMGGKDNVAIMHGTLDDVMDARGLAHDGLYQRYFPDEAEYTAVLEGAGFEVLSMERFPRPTPLPGDVAAWYETFAADHLALIPEGERTAVLDEVREALRPHILGDDGIWRVDYVRLRFLAQKQEQEKVTA